MMVAVLSYCAGARHTGKFLCNMRRFHWCTVQCRWQLAEPRLPPQRVGDMDGLVGRAGLGQSEGFRAAGRIGRRKAVALSQVAVAVFLPV